MTEHLGTSVRNVMTVNPVTKVSDVIRWRLDLILLGNWSLPAVHIAQEQKQKTQPTGTGSLLATQHFYSCGKSGSKCNQCH